MSKIVLTRLDGRLIHGQVAANALKRSAAKRLIIIDDALVDDPFQCEVLKYVTPTGISLEIMNTADAGARFAKDQFGEDGGSVFILLKDVANAYRAFQAGCIFPSIQVGGLRDTSNGRKNITIQIYINEDEARMLDEMQKAGIEVYFQPLPDTSPIPWANVKRKHFSGI